jgi:hypothetical protein
MLINRLTDHEILTDFDSIHNYYEQLVHSKLIERVQSNQLSEELVPDVACVALNHLPPRYIRYDVDMAFYLSPKEYEEIENKVAEAVTHAILFVAEREGSEKSYR